MRDVKNTELTTKLSYTFLHISQKFYFISPALDECVKQ